MKGMQKKMYTLNQGSASAPQPRISFKFKPDCVQKVKFRKDIQQAEFKSYNILFH